MSSRSAAAAGRKRSSWRAIVRLGGDEQCRQAGIDLSFGEGGALVSERSLGAGTQCSEAFRILEPLALPGAHRVAQCFAGRRVFTGGDRLADRLQHVGRKGDGDLLGALHGGSGAWWDKIRPSMGWVNPVLRGHRMYPV